MKRVSPWAKAARTRKRNAAAKKRAARERSARARYAALVRWYGTAHIPSSKKKKGKIPKKRATPTTKKRAAPTPKKRAAAPTPKKRTAKKVEKRKRTKPGPKPRTKKQADIQAKYLREKRKRREEQRRRILAEERMAKLEKRIVKGGVLEKVERFGAAGELPPRMKHETDMAYAKRVIRQLSGENVYTVEAAIEYYRAISDETGLSGQRVFSLFMSPQVA